MADMDRDLEGVSYRKLLEFMKSNGIEPMISFYEDFNKLMTRYLVFDALYKGKHPTLAFVQKHKDVVRFIRELKQDSYPKFLYDKKFLEFVKKLDDENISKQIEGARALEELGVYTVDLGIDTTRDCRSFIQYDDEELCGIVKYYSNGDITYRRCVGACNDEWDEYFTDVSFSTDDGNFLLSIDMLGGNSSKNKFVSVTDFGFDTSLLPSIEEFNRVDVPETLRDSKVYVKRY